MTQIIQLRTSTGTVDEMLAFWRVTHPSLSPTLALFLTNFQEAEVNLKVFAYYISDAIRIFGEPLFGICLTQAIKRYKCSSRQGDELEYDNFFEVLTYIAADLLHNIKIEDHHGTE